MRRYRLSVGLVLALLVAGFVAWVATRLPEGPVKVEVVK